ncbi:uncharacterized protein LOC128961782 [Oppia nitens]|uniref:uncharacterized protein LOC128961782 n=1 Tax=Oppia nitens TaxID=1686743 RepID=UPI0023DB33DD|nr:uncharacterized protein LOC128961782 [Oppia nitens]XP_054164029.1 uncharacterized protein LOC128961782 [Oppia nitens]
MASDNWSQVCSQLQSGNYKTVRLQDSKIRLFFGDNYYTFTLGDIRSLQTNQISDLFPYDLSPIQECFENNGKTYYIRQNRLIEYNGANIGQSRSWNPNQPTISCVAIRINGYTVGFFVPPNSYNSMSGQSMSSANNIQVIAYGSSSSVSMSNYNGNQRLIYNGWQIPTQFNAFVANSDQSLTFFNGNKYCIVYKNDNSNGFVWRDVTALFGC